MSMMGVFGLQALKKKQKAGRELEKVEELIKPVGSSDDKENVTDEERFMLRKLGLKMRAYLLMGELAFKTLA